MKGRNCQQLGHFLFVFTQIHQANFAIRTEISGYGVFLITSKVLDARRRGATTEAYGVIGCKEERSKATPQMILDGNQGFL